MQYLITGGTGFIGCLLLERITQKKDYAIVLSRKHHESTESIKYITCLSEIADDTFIDCIVNLAGKRIDCLWTLKNKKTIFSSRIEMTKDLVRLIKRLHTKPKIMISASAVGYYGATQNDLIKESSEPGTTFPSHVCLNWESEAHSAESYGVRVCIMRLGVVLGSSGGFIKKMTLPFNIGLGGKLGSGRQPFPWIHVKDVLNIIDFLTSKKECSGPYNIVSPDAISNKEMTIAIASELNRPALFNMPIFIIKLLFGEMGENLLLNGCKAVPERLQQGGYVFLFPKIKDALADILR